MRLSLGKKLVLLLVVFALALSALALAVSYRALWNMRVQQYTNKADEIAAVMARVVDAENACKVKDEVSAIYDGVERKVTSEDWGSPEFDVYLSHYAHLEQMPEYQQLLAELRNLQDVLDVDCLYTTYIEPDDEHVVYLVDAAEEDRCPIGCIDPLYEFNRQVLEDPTLGFPAYITNTEEYGWLVTAAAPIYASDGSVALFAFVDISVNAIRSQQNSYFNGIASVVIVFIGVLCLMTALFVGRFITRPLRELSEVAGNYYKPGTEGRTTFDSLDIHTHDEIEELHKSMIHMERDIDSYIDNLLETQEKLRDSRQEANLMSDLAHKDALTGIRNRLAYEQEVRRLEERLAAGGHAFGIAVADLNNLKDINDRYGHDCGDVSLRRAGMAICSVFVHSPVFRIGGDEFAIVLENNDYEKIEELVDEFYATLAEQRLDEANGLKPWERISVALGYALYDPACDADVESVFQRADRDMYRQKRAMKGMDSVR